MITSLGFETLGKLAVYTWYGYEDVSRRDGQIQKKKPKVNTNRSCVLSALTLDE